MRLTGNRVLIAVAATVLAACSRSPETAAPDVASATKAAPPQAAIGAWGFDVGGMDTSVHPGDDFYKYANGNWLATNKIPPDLTSWGAFTKLAVDTEVQLQGIIDTVPADAAAGSAEQKVHDFYRSYLDVAAIDKAGLTPASAGLSDIAAAKTHADIARLMGRPDLGLDTPINPQVTID